MPRIEELALGELVFPQHRLELQGTLVVRFRHDSGETPKDGFPNAALLALGITDRLTVDVELPAYVDADSYALSVEAGLLYNLLNSAEAHTAVSVLLEGRTAAFAGAAVSRTRGLTTSRVSC